MADNGPCSICKELSKFGAFGMPCKPTSCQCRCHWKSRAAILKKTYGDNPRNRPNFIANQTKVNTRLLNEIEKAPSESYNHGNI